MFETLSSIKPPELFLHACNADLGAAQKAVNGVMGSVLEAVVTEVPDIKDGVVGHWKYCLTRIYDDDPAPSDLYVELEQAAKKHNLTVPEKGKLAVIKPSPWKTDNAVVGVVGPGT